MAVNDKQKLVTVDISANTENLIQAKLALGYVILFIVNLQPSVNKLLIIYATPEAI